MITVAEEIQARVRERLAAVLERSTEGRIVLPSDGRPVGSLQELGLDSVGLLSFLVAVEDEFGIEWQDSVASEMLASLDAMADYIQKEIGDAS